MDPEVLARIEALRVSRRQGAQAPPPPGDADGDAALAAWVVHKHFDKLDCVHGYVESAFEGLDPEKLTVVSAEAEATPRDAEALPNCRFERSCLRFGLAFRFPRECSDAFVRRNAPSASLVLALCLAEELRAASASARSGGDEEQASRVGLRWPGDVLRRDAAGLELLARARQLEVPRAAAASGTRAPGDEDARSDCVVVGVSLDAGSLNRGAEDTTAAFRERLALRFARALRGSLFVNGFEALAERASALEVNAGQAVTLQLIDAASPVQGTCVGINASGHLAIRGSDGRVTSYPLGAVLALAAG
eukprot:TRINITY_DN32068_c0_g1_i1.p1 TRINITY_DN32068_c0_g1~~TRINITY_DN32068_c0_g1_i1.p1  ORF type:complete len:324 (-),score=79.95 TRINITY_DN32068_c0_g1_i1:51-968(-)